MDPVHSIQIYKCVFDGKSHSINSSPPLFFHIRLNTCWDLVSDITITDWLASDLPVDSREPVTHPQGGRNERDNHVSWSTAEGMMYS